MRITTKKINRFALFCFGRLPFILLLVFLLKIHINDSETNLELTGRLQNGFDQVNSCFTFVKVLPWYTPLMKILDGKFRDSTSSMSVFVYQYFNYWVIILLTDLVFYLFSFFILLIKNMIEKLGGDLL